MNNYLKELSNIELIRFAQKLMKLNYIDRKKYTITTFERERKSCTFYFNNDKDCHLDLFNNKATCTFGEPNDVDDIDKMWKLELYKYFGQKYLQDLHESELDALTTAVDMHQSNIDRFHQEFGTLTEFINNRKENEVCK